MQVIDSYALPEVQFLVKMVLNISRNRSCKMLPVKSMSPPMFKTEIRFILIGTIINLLINFSEISFANAIHFASSNHIIYYQEV